MGADHREYWFAMTGWSLRPEFKASPELPGIDGMQEQLFNLAFWYWLYDRTAELGHDGSISLLSLREEFFAQFGVLYNGWCETFNRLLETQKKRKRIYEQRGRVRIVGWNQHKLKGMRPIEQKINERNRQRKHRARDTDVTDPLLERDPRARAHTPTPTPTPTPDTDSRLQTPTLDASAKKPPRVADPRIKILIDYHFENFGKHFPGKRYVVNGAKEGKLLGKLLQTFDEDGVKAIDDALFTIDDPFIKQSGYTIGVLYACANKLQLPPIENEPKGWAGIREFVKELKEKQDAVKRSPAFTSETFGMLSAGKDK